MKPVNPDLANLIDKLSITKDKLLEDRTWLEFRSWINREENKKYQKTGIKRTTIETAITEFKRLNNRIEKGSKLDPESLSWRKKIETYKNKAVIFKQAVDEFLSEVPTNDPFFLKVWVLYFFHIPKYEIEPRLGKAVLRGLSPGYAKLENIESSIASYYSGNYRKIDNRIYVLDLNSPKGNQNLHIKVHYSAPKRDELLIGSYLTSENNNITRGTIILAKPENNSDQIPEDLSFFDSNGRFQSVHPLIRRFLLLKKHNYFKLPSSIHTYKELERFLKSHRETWGNRYLEEPEPRLFLSTPGLSISEETFYQNKVFIDKLVENLKTSIGDLVDIRIHNNRMSDKEIASPQTLVNLKNTRFFVLIYTKTEIGSYSLVQLGWALAHCKVVMLFHEEGSISEHILTIPKNVVTSSFKSLEESTSKIQKLIEIEVSRSLKSSSL